MKKNILRQEKRGGRGGDGVGVWTRRVRNSELNSLNQAFNANQLDQPHRSFHATQPIDRT